jgi:beta-mannosidase
VLAAFLENEGSLSLWIVNDRIDTISVSGKVEQIGFDGEVIKSWEVGATSAGSDTAQTVWSVPQTDYADTKAVGFFLATFSFAVNGATQEFGNFFFPARFKDAKMQPATISRTVEETENGSRVTLTTDKPAFFVTLESDRVRVWSDSSFVLVPGQEKVVTCPEKIAWGDVTVYQLNTVGV